MNSYCTCGPCTRSEPCQRVQTHKDKSAPAACSAEKSVAQHNYQAWERAKKRLDTAEAVIKAARELYSMAEIMINHDATEDDHYRAQRALRDMHDALKAFDYGPQIMLPIPPNSGMDEPGSPKS